MDKRTFTLQPLPHPSRQRAKEAIDLAPDGYYSIIQEPTRSLDANAAMWPILECFAKQKKWPVNGELVWLTAEEWKDVLTAAFDKETIRLAQGIDGGVVMLGKRTSMFSKKRFSEWLEFLNATAAIMGVDVR